MLLIPLVSLVPAVQAGEVHIVVGAGLPSPVNAVAYPGDTILWENRHFIGDDVTVEAHDGTIWCTDIPREAPGNTCERSVEELGLAPGVTYYYTKTGGSSNTGSICIPEPATLAITEPTASAVLIGDTLVRGTVAAAFDVDWVEVRLGTGPWVRANGVGDWAVTIDARAAPNGITTVEARAQVHECQILETSTAVEVDNPAFADARITRLVSRAADAETWETKLRAENFGNVPASFDVLIEEETVSGWRAFETVHFDLGPYEDEAHEWTTGTWGGRRATIQNFVAFDGVTPIPDAHAESDVADTLFLDPLAPPTLRIQSSDPGTYSTIMAEPGDLITVVVEFTSARYRLFGLGGGIYCAGMAVEYDARCYLRFSEPGQYEFRMDLSDRPPQRPEQAQGVFNIVGEPARLNLDILSPADGSVVSPLVDVHGTAGADAGFRGLWISLDGARSQKITAGETWIKSYDFGDDFTGTEHDFEVTVVDLAGRSVHDVGAVTIDNPLKPDFVVDRLLVQQDHQENFGRPRVVVTIANDGTKAAPPAASFEYFHDGAWHEFGAVSPSVDLEPGTTLTLARSWSDASLVGEFPIRVTLDPAGAYVELDEANNQATASGYHWVRVPGVDVGSLV